jgi:hypothetical protein
VAGCPQRSRPAGSAAGERLICRRCVEEANDLTDAATSVLSADDLAEADQWAS